MAFMPPIAGPLQGERCDAASGSIQGLASQGVFDLMAGISRSQPASHARVAHKGFSFGPRGGRGRPLAQPGAGRGGRACMGLHGLAWACMGLHGLAWA